MEEDAYNIAKGVFKKNIDERYYRNSTSGGENKSKIAELMVTTTIGKGIQYNA